jgi:hypothetical protein
MLRAGVGATPQLWRVAVGQSRTFLPQAADLIKKSKRIFLNIPVTFAYDSRRREAIPAPRWIKLGS